MMEIETFEHGVTRQYLDGRSIVVIKSSTPSRASTDVWANLVLDTIRDWPHDRPYLAVYDTSESGITPYSRHKSNEVADASIPLLDGLPAAYAVVLPRNVIGQIIKLFAERSLSQTYPMWPASAFTSLDDALNWLRELRPQLLSKIEAGPHTPDED